MSKSEKEKEKQLFDAIGVMMARKAYSAEKNIGRALNEGWKVPEKFIQEIKNLHNIPKQEREFGNMAEVLDKFIEEAEFPDWFEFPEKGLLFLNIFYGKLNF